MAFIKPTYKTNADNSALINMSQVGSVEKTESVVTVYGGDELKKSYNYNIVFTISGNTKKWTYLSEDSRDKEFDRICEFFELASWNS